MAEQCTVYLIHFSVEIGSENRKGKARHYLGSAADLESRIREHMAGNGAAILKHCNHNNVKWEVVRTWKAGRDFERKLKKRKNARLLCPCCNPENFHHHAKG